jgi:hypothetical protein
MKRKTVITILLAVLSLTCSTAKKKPTTNTTLRGYPSGTIDEYHFHAIPFTLLIDRNGNIVEKNVPPTTGKINELLK